jgi:hypothetical protein
MNRPPHRKTCWPAWPKANEFGAPPNRIGERNRRAGWRDKVQEGHEMKLKLSNLYLALVAAGILWIVIAAITLGVAAILGEQIRIAPL